MEREARKVQEKEFTGNRRNKLLEEKQYASNSKEQLCLRDATEDMEKTYNEKGMRNRMQSKQQLPHMDRLGGWGGSPQGGNLQFYVF